MAEISQDTRSDADRPGQRPVAKPVGAARRFKTPRTIMALILREMQTSYGRSVGGYAWAVLEPAGGIALLTLVISVGFRVRVPSLGDNFALFFGTGILVLTMTLSIANKVATSIDFSKPLLFYPGVKYTDALIARFLLTTLTQVMVFYIVMTGIHVVFDLRSTLRIEWIALSLGLTALLGGGIGAMNAFLFNVFPIWQRIWDIATRPLFLVSTTIYTFEDVPREWQDVALLNPLVHTIGFMRRGFYVTYDAQWASWTYVAGLGAVGIVGGLLFLGRFHRAFINR